MNHGVLNFSKHSPKGCRTFHDLLPFLVAAEWRNVFGRGQGGLARSGSAIDNIDNIDNHERCQAVTQAT